MFNIKAMLSIFLQGFLLQASLILALGAQNIFVLNSGLKKQKHLLVAFVCSVCDSLLILIGVLGVATFFIQYPILKLCLGILGVSFLFVYALLKLREAFKATQINIQSTQTNTTKQTILISLGFSLLNPHVYLDTIVLIGGYSSKFLLLSQRFSFGAGAALFSIIWFFGLSILASYGSKLLKNPKAMRILSLASGLILLFLSYKLGKDVWQWFMLIFEN